MPKVPDHNVRNAKMGVSQVQTFIDAKGQRSSTAVAYFTEDVLRRPNLKIATGQTVTRIFFSDRAGGKLRATGVEMRASRHSPISYRVKAKRDVVLSAGAINTPQLLLISGVGPAADLRRLGIEVVKDMPGVGENLQDQCVGDARPS